MIILLSKNLKVLGKYKKVNIITLLLVIVIIISGYVNRNTSENSTFLASIVYSMSILDCFISFELFKEKGILKDVIKQFLFLLTFYLLINDLLMVFRPNLYIANGEYYFLGNKFKIMYLHCFDAVFFMIVKNKVSIIFFLISLFVSLYTNCVSGLVLVLVLFLLIIYKPKKASPILITSILIISSLIALSFEQFINIPIIKYFINDVFDKANTIASRNFIYNHIVEIIQTKPLLGFGYNNSYPVLGKLGIGVNTQNSLFETIFQFGWIGLILTILLIYETTKNGHKEKSLFGLSLYSLIIGFGILSSIEIVINIYFIFILALYNCCREEKILNE